MKTSVAILSVVLMAACRQNDRVHNAAAEPPATMKTQHVFSVSMVDNKKDPFCGMPVTAGIGDTAHYNGKVYGFCSEECKAAFLADPKKMSAKAD